MENKLQFNNILLYTGAEGKVKIEIIYESETFWLSQKRIAELFGVERSVVTKHLKNIFESGELDENSVCAFFAHTASDGKNYKTQFLPKIT
jgi:hypothetical protein